MSAPIEQYLDELADRLPLRGRALRRVLCEVEDHLREALTEGVESGMTVAAATERALSRFGHPGVVAEQFARQGVTLRSWVWNLALSLGLLGAIGLFAIGVSGSLAAASGAAFGKDFVAGDPPGIRYTSERCAQLRELAPGAPTCNEAAVRHHYDEIVGMRLGAGVVGGAGLVGWMLLGRRWRRPGVLPDSFVPVAGAAVFGMAAVMLLAEGGLELAFSGAHTGPGQLLTGGVVALVMAVGFLFRLAPVGRGRRTALR
ncbi:MAG TPA: permease prefix domain 1-containing protein [Acidimicrobiales bacterium]|nr:permease prefix domain 1-containing protein [Acidimicrobiales bacterium]